MPRHSSIGL
ncbi:hypothetical protein E2C01_095466 [Portunus trituberculatus]|uniref:Uncharacterized protein n=1 Tax=Portunus trituberculatus TaxID=210409 RepID=A0A5B7K3W9_PORTR|nr:hypothetical protein [Portunus trituberculatus]